MKRRARFVPLVITFGGTGAAGLLAEQSFEKLLGTLLGTSTPASAAVLATYFGGLMIGGLFYGRVLRRRASAKPTLRAYGFLECWIALACAILALSFTRLEALFAPVLVLGVGSPIMLTLLRLAIAASWLLPVTIPMGATFPAVVDGLDTLIESSDPDARARTRGMLVSALYTSNLLGAIAAAALGPYLVLPRVGLDGTLWVAAGLDLGAAVLCFAMAFWASRRVTQAPEDGEGGEASVELAVTTTRETRLGRATLPIVAALSGMVLFSLEVTWTHLIGTVIGSSVYAFATMLAVVLAGLGLGAAAAGLVASRVGSVHAHLPGLAFVAAWATLSFSLGRWPEMPHALAQIGPFVTGFEDAERARALEAARQLLPSSTLLGMVYPLLLRLDVLPRSRVGGTLGRMGAFNALGSIAGAFSTLFIWIPLLGAEWTLRCLAGLCLVAGALLVFAFSTGAWLRRLAPIVAAAGLIATALAPRWDRLALTSGEQVYLERSHVRATSKLRFFAEDPHGGFTTVIETPGPNGRALRVLLSNGKFQGNDGGEMDAQNAIGLIPMMFVHDWRDALVIGLGTGRSANVVAKMGFEHITVGEISPGIVAAAKTEFGHINGDVLAQPNVKLALTDARNQLLIDPTTYDLISLEISSVWIAGATNLYAHEFYELCKRRLNKAGVLQQWIQLHHIGFDEIASVVATVRAVFPHVSFFFEGRQGIVIGSNEPQETQPEFFARVERLGPGFGVTDAAALSTHLHAARLLRPADVDALIAAARPRPNTDANRFLEYATPRHLLDRAPEAKNVRALARWASFVPQELAPGATGPIADAARKVAEADVKRELGLE